MSLKDTLRKVLSPELFQQTVDALGDDFNYDLVPRSRLNQVIKQRDELKEKPGGESQTNLDESETQTSEATQNSGNSNNTKQKTVEELTREFEAAKQVEIQKIKLQYAVMEKLRSSEVAALDPELTWSLLDKDKIVCTETGEIQGIEDQLKTLSTSKPFLFGNSSQNQTNQGGGRKESDSGTGKTGGASGQSDTSAVDAELAKIFGAVGVDLSDENSKT